ncbi:MAG: N-acetyl sugar amidotransferase [Alphaproteobacteria bacterium]|jgi:N-acetyl sugar amidotransferase|nr:N-acetyl sugar amidotransferase [Alphaproteobacteria bacterium]MBU2040790.1 N-acetyl sugar amidotransferase [Alphaproteobacteria bacterium]MBU2207900.1 N-acetyl sugar amidotransferase [Alphaproteobacteria bacterium]MBU2291263.1 N-acetyl sugar amidotransferase [Alphaproteobacteria bacterium]MBU2396697.1 N-acetyl sugar amidotransferase [Alphaproteobacteria bacterium]
MLTYCRRCVMPDTKPDLHLDGEGICNACRSYESRKAVDWDQRHEELVELLARYRRPRGDNWDCIVPVSGGKDSTYQVVRMLQYGLNPLCVTSTTCDLSDLGRTNIENLKHLGVDYIEVSPNPLVRAKLNRVGLLQVGDISWPEHVGIFTIPVRAAVQFNVPLIVWGENSQNEYGGPAAAAEGNVLTRRWLEEFGGLLGMRVSDLIGQEGIEEKHLINYSYPSDEDLARVGVTGLFLGHYIPWDGLANTLIASANGFHSYNKVVEGSMVNYENLDNYQTGIHDYFKYLKFGFGRASDLASLHIRRGRLTRQDGLDAVRRLDGRFPWEYLGKSLEDILRPLDITVDDFIRTCDKFTNKKIFKRDVSGALVKDRDGNLTKLNFDNS